MNLSSLIPTITDLRMCELILSERSLYAHLVSALPAISHQLVGQLTLAGGGNYLPLTLTGVEVQQSGAGAIIVAQPITWIGLTTSAPTAGVAFCLQTGISPSSSDWIFSTLAFVDSAGLPTVRKSDGSNLTIDLAVNPIFKTRS